LVSDAQADRVSSVESSMCVGIARTADAAENYLAGELRRVRHELQAMGVPGEIIKRELRAMEPAVRGELWRLMFGPLSGTGRRR